MDPGLEARLAQVEESLAQVEAELASPEALADPRKLAELGKRHAGLEPVVALLRRWRQAVADQKEATELAAQDAAMAEDFARMAKEREEEAAALEDALRAALVPVDPLDSKDVIVEIRAAAGGDEAAIWAGDLLRMYQRFAERHRFEVEPLESAPSEAGGYSRVTVGISGRGAYSRFRYEGGVHRVQRVPKTEAAGRVHTSTATVAVLPEAEEVEVEVAPEDVRIDVFRSQGPGGQSVNTTDSAVRITHLPTGLVVTCQDEKSQLQNKAKAFRILRARLQEIKLDEQAAATAGARRSQVGTGERSEKIRTYNYKENRVTDHRLGLTLHRLAEVLDGDLDELVEGLAARRQAEALGG
ncbi:MAG TPA: peptide chain release factor 1 [Acidimicrobiia bacterium]|jgi:peptide chain release factor 1